MITKIIHFSELLILWVHISFLNTTKIKQPQIFSLQFYILEMVSHPNALVFIHLGA